MRRAYGLVKRPEDSSSDFDPIELRIDPTDPDLDLIDLNRYDTCLFGVYILASVGVSRIAWSTVLILPAPQCQPTQTVLEKLLYMSHTLKT
jgi:hypothetical protein